MQDRESRELIKEDEEAKPPLLLHGNCVRVFYTRQAVIFNIKDVLIIRGSDPKIHYSAAKI